MKGWVIGERGKGMSEWEVWTMALTEVLGWGMYELLDALDRYPWDCKKCGNQHI